MDATAQETPLTTQVLQKVLEWAETTSNFVAEQTPLVVDEIIQWGIAKAIIGICISLIIFGIGIFLFSRLGKYIKGYEEERRGSDEEALYIVKIVSSIIGGVASIITFIVFWAQVYQLVYIYMAPRLYIIETLNDLLASKT